MVMRWSGRQRYQRAALIRTSQASSPWRSAASARPEDASGAEYAKSGLLRERMAGGAVLEQARSGGQQDVFRGQRAACADRGRGQQPRASVVSAVCPAVRAGSAVLR
jgi:hypothetical protein